MGCSAATFLNKYAPSIEGWLFDGAAYVTEYLLGAQTSMDVNAGCLEIGVYKGKYLSYLAAASNVPCVGMDVFIFDQEIEAEQNIKRVMSATESQNSTQLVKVNTRTHTADTFRDALTAAGVSKLTFASIDGDHSCAGVMHDLHLVEKNLAPGGIIAMDDMFSAMSPAVSEGFFNYMKSGSELKPIAFSDNKLFMTTPGFDELYQIKLMVEMSKGENLIGERWLDGNQSGRIRPFLKGTMIHI